MMSNGVKGKGACTNMPLRAQRCTPVYFQGLHLAGVSGRTATHCVQRCMLWQGDGVCFLQAYVVCELPDKLNILWAFIKAHLKVWQLGPLARHATSHRAAAVSCACWSYGGWLTHRWYVVCAVLVCAQQQRGEQQPGRLPDGGPADACARWGHVLCAQAKVLVFLSTCKQVKYVFEAFRRLRPGVPLRCIHGKMKQMKRMAAFYEFSEARRPPPAVPLLDTHAAAGRLPSDTPNMFALRL